MMTDHEHECTHYRTAGEGWEETIVCSVCFTPPPLDEQVAVLNEHAKLKRKIEQLEKGIIDIAFKADGHGHVGVRAECDALLAETQESGK